MSNIKAISFDIGDTLVFDNPARKERIKTALNLCGITTDSIEFERVYSAMDARGTEIYLRGIDPDEPQFALELTSEMLTKLGVGIDIRFAKYVLEKYLKIEYVRYVHPGVVKLLQSLRDKGLKLSVISDWEPNLPDYLGQIGLMKFFESISVSSLVGTMKPGRLLFEDSICKLGIEPSDILHVGDYYELDVIGARSTGMNTLLFDSQSRYTNRELDVPVVNSFTELDRYLSNL